MSVRIKSPTRLFTLGLCLAACGCSSSHDATTVSAGGVSSLGGSAGTPGFVGSGGAGAAGKATATTGNRFDSIDNPSESEPAVASRYQACMTYMRAQCQRRFDDCGEQSTAEDPCIASLDRCPDIVFSPGSTWTEASLQSCGDDWKKFSCDEIRQNKRPSCSLAKGTRPIGDPCLFPNQCATG
ncbi:MAG TPA: hypothetical protein VIV60_25450, partial [Polyangiaceae bacterium]